MISACPRAWTNADAVAATREFLSQPKPRRAAIRDLMRELVSSDPVVRRCAADLSRRVSAREPGILRRFLSVFVDLMAELPMEEWQARGYATLTAVLNAGTHAERMQLAAPVRRMLGDERIALRAIALEAFALLAAAELELRDEAMMLLEQARHDKTAAVRCRARRMLPVLLASERFRPERRKVSELADVVVRRRG